MNMKNVQGFSLFKVAIWTRLFGMALFVCVFKCLRRLIFQRLMRADFIVKPDICVYALLKVAFWRVFPAICFFFFECRKKGFGRCVVIRTAARRKRLLDLTMLEEFRKCTRNILAASVAVEGQVRGFAALCVCISKGRRDKAGTGAAGYTGSHDSAGKEINDGAKIYSRIFDLKIGDVTYPDLIWMISGKLSLQQIPLPALLQLFSPNSTLWSWCKLWIAFAAHMRKCIRCNRNMIENYDVKAEGGGCSLKITPSFFLRSSCSLTIVM